MKHPFIKAELQVRGVPPAVVAERLGVTPQAVSNVIRGNIASRKIANEIARITGFPVSKLWPGRYDDKQPRKAA